MIDASGRLSKLTAPPELSGDTGIAYVNRNYRRHDGVEPGPMNGPVAWTGAFDGYAVYVFPHERGHFSAVIVRPTADADLSVLRHVEAFDPACEAIPGLADWTDPRLATPTSGVLVGVRLLNVYRPQLCRPGLVALGDAVATTAPTAGRGVAMASMQIGGLLDLLDDGADPITIAAPFGAWCDQWIRPWVQDHLDIDAEAVRRWQGAEMDLTQPLTSAAIVAAAERRPPDRSPPRWPPGDDGDAVVAGAGRAAGPGRLRDGLASTLESGPDVRATDRHRRDRGQRAKRRVSSPPPEDTRLRMRFATVPENGHVNSALLVERRTTRRQGSMRSPV